MHKERTKTLLKVMGWLPDLAVTESMTACPEEGTGEVKIITDSRHVTVTVKVEEFLPGFSDPDR